MKFFWNENVCFMRVPIRHRCAEITAVGNMTARTEGGKVIAICDQIQLVSHKFYNLHNHKSRTKTLR